MPLVRVVIMRHEYFMHKLCSVMVGDISDGVNKPNSPWLMRFHVEIDWLRYRSSFDWPISPTHNWGGCHVKSIPFLGQKWFFKTFLCDHNDGVINCETTRFQALHIKNCFHLIATFTYINWHQYTWSSPLEKIVKTPDKNSLKYTWNMKTYIKTE